MGSSPSVRLAQPRWRPPPYLQTRNSRVDAVRRSSPCQHVSRRAASRTALTRGQQEEGRRQSSVASNGSRWHRRSRVRLRCVGVATRRDARTCGRNVLCGAVNTSESRKMSWSRKIQALSLSSSTPRPAQALRGRSSLSKEAITWPKLVPSSGCCPCTSSFFQRGLANCQ
jgi:hypothetical protein